MNIVLGSGDPSKFDLLGGTFGEGGDYVMGRMAGLKRKIAEKKVAKVLRAGGGPDAPLPWKDRDRIRSGGRK
ncbi:MAG: hypothetical protein KA763_00610 [Xanthomonadales bacterium]|nr:hypothetical protein [Xanthomonadales bacterium]